jgi:hypothetical protein
MSDRRQAATKIQKVVRGWLCRRQLHRQSRCFEIRLKNIMPKRKPPIYRKRRRPRLSSSFDPFAIIIQKHFRGYLQRKKFKELFIEKMLREQEEEFRSRILLIEKELDIEETPGTNISPSPVKKKSKSLYLELPLPMSQRRNPSAYRTHRSVLFEYDYYILAATEIQRVFRGYLVRKHFGYFPRVRKRIIKVQKIYRIWKDKKKGQLELAGTLMNKQCNILATSFKSYQHLKSLILTQDRQGTYSKFIQKCEDKLLEAGVTSAETVNSMLRARIRELESEKLEQEQFYKGILSQSQAKYKSAIREYLKGMKGLKFNMELVQKSNFEHISKIVRNLASVSRDLDSESFYENSTFLPDVSFTDKSSINFI